MSPHNVVVLGSFMMDLVVRAARRPLAGETVVGSGFEMFLGGKGFNQAIAA
jgi:ribokinase